jgi:hypothetical protein
MVETQRIPLAPEEHEKLGRLIRAAEEAKAECTRYVNELGGKYSIYASSRDCQIGFENGSVVIKEPQLVLRATKTQ